MQAYILFAENMSSIDGFEIETITIIHFTFTILIQQHGIILQYVKCTGNDTGQALFCGKVFHLGLYASMHAYMKFQGLF